MNDKIKKMKKKFIHLFLSIIVFIFSFISLPIPVSANNDVLLDSVFASLINASQGGRGGGQNFNIRNFGTRIGGTRNASHRLGVTPGRGGNSDKVNFNPSKVDLDFIYNEYNNYIQGNPASYYTVPVNTTIYSTNDGIRYNYIGLINPGTTKQLANFGGNPKGKIIYNVPKGYSYAHIEIKSYTGGKYLSEYYLPNDRSGSGTRLLGPHEYSGPTLFRTSLSSSQIAHYYFKIDGSYAVDYGEYTTMTIGNIYLSNSTTINTEELDFVHNINSIPTKEQFIQNYVNTYNVEYNYETNQLVENNVYYQYELSDFSDNSITINQDYVTNNFITIEGDTIIEKNAINYTNILTRILNAIKALPQQIVDLMPEFVNEAGTNIWDFLTAIVEAIGNIGTSIVNGIIDNLLPLIEAILNIIFPTQEQLEESKGLLDSLFNTFQEKTDFITSPIQSFSSIYGSSRSAMFSTNNDTNLYNRTILINDTEVHILPHSLEPAISAFRMVSTGFVVILTMISIYTRFRGVVKH